MEEYVKKFFDSIIESFLAKISLAVNKASAMLKVIEVLGEVSRDLKGLRDDVKDIKEYLSRQEEIAKIMIEQGHFGDDVDEFFDEEDEEIDDKDMN